MRQLKHDEPGKYDLHFHREFASQSRVLLPKNHEDMLKREEKKVGPVQAQVYLVLLLLTGGFGRGKSSLGESPFRQQQQQFF